MIRNFAPSSPFTARAEIAAAIFAGGLALFALPRAPVAPQTPAPAAVQAASPAKTPAPGGARSGSYYPEHLAALQSLDRFHPIADEGVKPLAVAAPAGPFKPAEARPARRADAATKPQPAPPQRALLQTATAAPVAEPQPAAPPARLWGVAVPGPAEIGAHVAANVVTNVVTWRDAASGWTALTAATLGGKVAELWR